MSSSSYACFAVSFTYLKKKNKNNAVLRTNIATNDDLVPHLTCTVADSDLQIREGAVMHPDPEIRGGFLEIFFRPFRPQFGPKLTGRPGVPGPLL